MTRWTSRRRNPSWISSSSLGAMVIPLPRSAFHSLISILVGRILISRSSAFSTRSWGWIHSPAAGSPALYVRPWRRLRPSAGMFSQ